MKIALIFLFGLFTSIAAFADEVCPKLNQDPKELFSEFKVRSIDKKGSPTGTTVSFDSKIKKGKVTVVRLFATWCPYCKRDLLAIEKKFAKELKDDKLEVVLVTFKSRKETPDSLKMFYTQGANELGVKPANYEWLDNELTSADLKSLAQKGSSLFPEFRGVPYALVFDKEGHLRFRGNFTESDTSLEKHYNMIHSLVHGRCS